uniref:Zinc finger PHD-type domain-containing protein n=2 Tax=Graphocephala atropunctata TaxID=36148 RepID=A0A1B6M9U5_9HEMI
MSKNPCGICKISVKYQAICCTGPCKLWHHSKCLNWSDKKFKTLTKLEIGSWLCDICKNSSEHGAEDIYELESKINNLSQNDSLDHETSLALAAEVGNALLNENNKLKQRLCEEKAKRTEYQLELEDKLLAAEEIVTTLKEKNNVLQSEIEFISNNLQSELNLKKELIEQAEEEKSFLTQQVNELQVSNSTTRQKCKQLEEQLQASLHTNETLRTQNNNLTSILNTSKEELKLKNNLIQTTKADYEELAEKLTEQAQNVKSYLKNFLENSKPHLTERANSDKQQKPTDKQTQTQNLPYSQNTLTPNLSPTTGNWQTSLNHLTSPTHSLTSRNNQNHNRNQYSASLLVAKTAAKHDTQQKHMPIFARKSMQDFKLSKSPPLNAKLRSKEENYEDFFLKHIDFYKDLMRKENTLTRADSQVIVNTPSTLPHQLPTQQNHSSPETQNQILQEPNTHQANHFLLHSNKITSKIKTK